MSEGVVKSADEHLVTLTTKVSVPEFDPEGRPLPIKKIDFGRKFLFEAKNYVFAHHDKAAAGAKETLLALHSYLAPSMRRTYQPCYLSKTLKVLISRLNYRKTCRHTVVVNVIILLDECNKVLLIVLFISFVAFFVPQISWQHAAMLPDCLKPH